MSDREATDVAVIGASLGGVLAAWRAAQAGCHVTLVAAHPWLGGQMTAQGVPPDEHPLIEAGGASASYLAFREDIRRLYRAQPGFRDRAILTPGTNPGDGWVSRLCFEPAHAARWFERLLAPSCTQGRLRLLRGWQLQAAQRQGPQVTEVDLQGPADRSLRLQARVFVDATDTGELIHQLGLPCRLGKEGRSDFGEPDAPAQPDRLDQQPVTHVMALRQQAQAGPVVPAPPSYDFWRAHLLPGHAHRLFSPCLPGPRPGTSARLPLQACPPDGPVLDWWRYRRVVSSAQWDDGRDEVTLVNWAQNDFRGHPLLDGPVPQAQVQAQARELSLCLLHWLQTEAPREDGGRGFPQWQLAHDVLGTGDGLAQQVYVRESRRIVARHTLTQTDLSAPPEPRADAVGIGWYNLDIHPTCVSGHGVNAPAEPFSLPLGVFVPQHADNLLPGCKNIGVTHLANACTRVHPVEWLVGEVAGLMAAQMVSQGRAAGALADEDSQIRQLQQALDGAGVARHWPHDLLARRVRAH